MDRCTAKAMFTIRKSTERFIEELILFVFEQPEFTSRTKHMFQKAKLNKLNYELALLHRDVTMFPWRQLPYTQYLEEDTKQVLLKDLRDFRRRVTMCFIDVLKIEGDLRTAKRAKRFYRTLFYDNDDNNRGQTDDLKTNRLGNAKSRLAGILRNNFKRQYSYRCDVSGPQSPTSDTAEVLNEKDEWCQSSDSEESD
ncbi:uncharacterized protein LOC117338774 [Pecten maximus]|uniref:uncharacterized protein LOC117338774 n=1 Tax=Pecten maximus TaxID=6579 RepID=UPI001458F9EB|nr:uncharacterized protein LOC117338774 [Pecten maximus]